MCDLLGERHEVCEHGGTDFARKGTRQVSFDHIKYGFVCLDDAYELITRQACLLELADDSGSVAAVSIFVAEFTREWVRVVKFVEDAREDFILGQLVGWLEVSSLVEILVVLADDLCSKAVKGVDSDFIGGRTDNLAEALAHGICPTVSEREAEDIFWQGICLLEDICSAHAEKLSLAGARACDDEQWAVNCIHCLLLGRIEVFVASRKVSHSCYYTPNL